MAKPQQPELHRSGLTPVDPGSVKTRRGAGGRAPDTAGGGVGPVPEENMPGHHPDVEQDKPVARFAQRAMALAREPEPPAEVDSPAKGDDTTRPAGQAHGPARETARPGGSSRQRPSVWELVPGLALLDAWRRPASAWSSIGENRSAWLAGLVLLPTLAPWRYSTRIKPRLQAASATER